MATKKSSAAPQPYGNTVSTRPTGGGKGAAGGGSGKSSSPPNPYGMGGQGQLGYDIGAPSALQGMQSGLQQMGGVQDRRAPWQQQVDALRGQQDMNAANAASAAANQQVPIGIGPAAAGTQGGGQYGLIGSYNRPGYDANGNFLGAMGPQTGHRQLPDGSWELM